jgi:hypothetical protein
MARLGRVTWRELVSRLRALGFDGPFYRGKHPYMIRSKRILSIPNPHEGGIGIDLLARLLRRAGIDRKEWEAL